VAVSVTLTADATAEVVAWKLPVLAPAGMFTVAGTATEDWLLDKATFMPPAGAAAERLIVHWLGLPPVTGDGAQPSEEMLGGAGLPPPLPLPPPPPPPPPPTVIEPEVADSVTGPPDGSDPAPAPTVT
jgi:autotransporter family porin